MKTFAQEFPVLKLGEGQVTINCKDENECVVPLDEGKPFITVYDTIEEDIPIYIDYICVFNQPLEQYKQRVRESFEDIKKCHETNLTVTLLCVDYPQKQGHINHIKDMLRIVECKIKKLEDA